MSFVAFILIFIVIVLASLPIAFAFLLTSVLPHLLDLGFAFNMELAFRSIVSGMNSFPLLAIPLFIVAGEIMAQGGISEALFSFFAYFIGNKRAGYPCAVIVTCLFYGAISGSGPATAAAVGSMTIPLLTKMNYDKRFSASIVAVAGGLGIIIPPSIPFIIYSTTVGVSTGDLFIAGVLPGILIGLCMMVYAWYYCKRNGEDRDRLMENYNELRKRGFLHQLKISFPALLSPVIVLGSIYGGVASPTEAACVSVFYSIVVSVFVYKNIKIREIPGILCSGVRNCAPILFIISCAVGFSRVLTLMHVPATVEQWMLSTFSSKIVILLVIIFVLLIVGMFMDTLPAILIFAPVIYPIATAIGMNPIHLGIVMVVNLAIGQVTPPMGTNLFVISALTKVPVLDIAKRAIPFILAFLFALLLITFIPEISLLLVGLA